MLPVPGNYKLYRNGNSANVFSFAVNSKNFLRVLTPTLNGWDGWIQQ